MIVALAVGLALLIQAFVVKPYQIPSPSMVPTLEVGQRVLVNRFIYHFEDPKIGDIVVFKPPAGAESDRCGARPVGGHPAGDGNRSQGGDVTYEPGYQPCPLPTPEKADVNFIKRIVAGPGDTVSIQDGVPVVNGVPAEEDFAEPCGNVMGCDLPGEITVPEGHYFMMGDNRGQSADSRFWGPVPEEWFIGKAFFTYWPPNRIGGV